MKILNLLKLTWLKDSQIGLWKEIVLKPQGNFIETVIIFRKRINDEYKNF